VNIFEQKAAALAKLRGTGAYQHAQPPDKARMESALHESIREQLHIQAEAERAAAQARINAAVAAAHAAGKPEMVWVKVLDAQGRPSWVRVPATGGSGY